MSAPDEEDDILSIDSIDPAPREAGSEGPPKGWSLPSWYDAVEHEWWVCPLNGGAPYRDPCPVTPLGAGESIYVFLSPFGQCRRLTSGQLHAKGGLTDLFSGSETWLLRHFRKFDAEKGKLVGRVLVDRCVAALIRACVRLGYYDDSQAPRLLGVWRALDGKPIVHLGDRILYDSKIIAPGTFIDGATYVVGPRRDSPSLRIAGETFEWEPGPANLGRVVTAHLNEWVWMEPEHCELFQGALYCAMLGSWLKWLSHVFIEAAHGAGKSALLNYAFALLGASAHEVQSNYTKAHFEQNFSGKACAFLVDEAEKDTDPMQMQRIIEFVRLLSDHKGGGGRGTASGKGRRIDVQGLILMAATVTDDWLPQDRSRITRVQLLPLRERTDRPPAPPAVMDGIVADAKTMSPGLRSRALSKLDLFQLNLETARAAILAMGGSPRDADQIGHLVAGFYSMTSDDPIAEAEDLTRYRPYVMSLQEAEDEEDEPSELLNTIFGIAPDLWRSGQRPTIGQVLARAREHNGDTEREMIESFGLRLERRGEESWNEAWLQVANKHPTLDEILSRYPRYQGRKRATILKQLRREIDGTIWKAMPSEKSERAYFATYRARFLNIPPVFLPSGTKR